MRSAETVEGAKDFAILLGLSCARPGIFSKLTGGIQHWCSPPLSNKRLPRIHPQCVAVKAKRLPRRSRIVLASLYTLLLRTAALFFSLPSKFSWQANRWRSFVGLACLRCNFVPHLLLSAILLVSGYRSSRMFRTARGLLPQQSLITSLYCSKDTYMKVISTNESCDSTSL